MNTKQLAWKVFYLLREIKKARRGDALEPLETNTDEIIRCIKQVGGYDKRTLQHYIECLEMNKWIIEMPSNKDIKEEVKEFFFGGIERKIYIINEEATEKGITLEDILEDAKKAKTT